MSDKPASFMVVFRGDISDKDLALLLLYPVTHSIPLEDGVIAHVLWCKSVDSSGSYLTVEAKHRSGDVFGSLQIPHWLVLTVVGSKNAPAIGFLAEVQNHEHQ